MFGDDISIFALKQHDPSSSSPFRIFSKSARFSSIERSRYGEFLPDSVRVPLQRCFVNLKCPAKISCHSEIPCKHHVSLAVWKSLANMKVVNIPHTPLIFAAVTSSTGRGCINPLAHILRMHILRIPHVFPNPFSSLKSTVQSIKSIRTMLRCTCISSSCK